MFFHIDSRSSYSWHAHTFSELPSAPLRLPLHGLVSWVRYLGISWGDTVEQARNRPEAVLLACSSQLSERMGRCEYAVLGCVYLRLVISMTASGHEPVGCDNHYKPAYWLFSVHMPMFPDPGIIIRHPISLLQLAGRAT